MRVVQSKQGLILILLLLSLLKIQAQQVYDVLDYGARADGIFENASIIQKAIDKASANGGGVVLIPEGTYRTTTLYLKDNVTLRLSNATIIGSPDYEAYPVNKKLYETYLLSKYYPTRCLITGRGVKNISIEGTGIIDGNGMHKNLLFPGNKRHDAIDLIKFQLCENVRIEGSGRPNEKLLITNSSHWALFPIGVDGLLIKNIKISNFGGPMPDGLPISDSRNVLVENVLVESDDDAITLKSGRPDGMGIMKNITIKNSVFRSRVCGFKLGPQTWGGYENIHISSCHFEGIGKPPGTQYYPNNGIVIQLASGGYVNGILVEDCTIAKEPSPIAVYVCRTLGRYTHWSEEKPADLDFGTIENVTFRNLRAYDVGTFGIMVEGREKSVIKDILFDGLYVSYPGGGTEMKIQEEQPEAYPNIYYLFNELHTWGMHIRHVEGITFKDVYMWTETHDPRKDMYTFNVKNFDRGNYKPQNRKK